MNSDFIDTLRDIIKTIPDNELLECFNEIYQYKTTGVLDGHKTREIRDKYVKRLGYNSPGVGVIMNEILLEIATRWKNEHHQPPTYR